VVVPALRQIEKDLKQDLPTSVILWSPFMQGPSVLIVPASSPATGNPPKSRGELRLSFRATAVTDRYLFFGEAVYDRDVVPGKTFSGFEVHGVVWIDNGTLKAKEELRTIRYSEWDFIGWK
jgi:hypothetical protein